MAKKALITGAGIAGLTAGLWLQRQGFEPVIVEQASAPLGGGFVVSLSDSAYHYADSLGVMDVMRAKDVKITHSSYHNSRTVPLLELDYKKLFKNVSVLQIMRDDVVDVLYGFARDEMEFRFNENINSIRNNSESVDVEFSSGLQESFDLAVIAEGANSPTRSILFPDTVHVDYLGLCCAAFRLPNVLALQKKFETHMQKGRYMATFTTPVGDLGAVFVWTSSDRQVPDKLKQRETLKAAFQDAGPVISKVLNQCPEYPDYIDTLKQIKARSWVNGRSVLIGDAAHCMTLFSGRGAAAAISGASRLAKHIERSPNAIEKALINFETESRRIIDPIQQQTRKAVRWYAPQNNIDWFLRDNAMRFLPNALFQKYFSYKYSNV